MNMLMTSHELCTCSLDRNALLERGAAGQGVLAVLVPTSPVAGGKLLSYYPFPPASSDGFVAPPTSLGHLAGRFIRLRRKRESIFGDDLFADPAWDMMLDLYRTSQMQERPISVTSLCIASAVPSTTALRWITTLIQKGLLTRHADATDGRRTFVSLTQEGARKMQQALRFWSETGCAG